MSHRTYIAALMLLLASCSGGSGETCVSDTDCFTGEVCRADKTCGAPLPDEDAGDDASVPVIDVDMARGDAAANNVSTPDGSANNGTTNNQNSDNNSTNNSNTPDMGDDDMSPADMTPMQACVVDPFIQCTDEEDSDNNSFPGETISDRTVGCQSSGFVPLDVTIDGRMCPLDPEDLYRFNIVECDDDEPGFVIEATLDVEQDCDPDLIHFDVEGIGTSCADPDPDDDQTIRCETLAGGARKISIIWPGSSVPVVGSIRFSIQTPDRMDVEFDYTLDVVLREP